MLTLSSATSSSYDTIEMASLNKVPSVIPMGAAQLQAATLQPQHFFITPNYALAANSSDTITQGGGIGITGTPWPAHAAASIRPTTGIPCYNTVPATDVFFNGQCILPIANNNSTSVSNTGPTLLTDKLPATPNVTSNITPTVNSGLVLLDPPPPVSKHSGKRHRKSHLVDTDESSPVKVKKETNEPMCTIRNASKDSSGSTASNSSESDNKISYPVSALIDLPGSLTRGSRTSSLSSSLSTVRFGGSLSQLWAASLSSLSGKLNNMKSTGNINADASLPSLGNQYFAFGGSLPELSLTSLSRLLPNSSSNNSTSTSITAAPSSTNLLTVLQPPLYVYPSQPHLATPFINANGSITFGSFLSTGSSLCSTQKPESPLPVVNVKNEDSTPCSTVDQSAGFTCSSTTSSSSSNCQVSSDTPGSLNTLAYVASAQKSLVAKHPQYTVQERGSPSGSGMSPTDPVNGMEGLQECGQTVGLSPLSNEQRIKMEDDEDCHSVGSYSEVKPYFMMMSPLNQGSNNICKKENKDKPYKCDYPGCGRCFSFPAHLKSHVQQIHISYRPCKCDFPGCGKRFYTPQHLNVHRRIHTGERPFVCPYTDCNKAFTTAGNLKNHIRTHTGERPYACKFEGCTKRFAEMSSLKKHELTHTGEKPYKCRVCGKAFSQAGSRNTHERKHNRTESDIKISRRYRIKRVANEEENVNNSSNVDT